MNASCCIYSVSSSSVVYIKQNKPGETNTIINGCITTQCAALRALFVCAVTLTLKEMEQIVTPVLEDKPDWLLGGGVIFVVI